MSLNWSLADIADHKTKCWLEPVGDEPRLNPVTNALIWTTMQIGLGMITTANADEFYARASLVEKMFGPTMKTATGDVPLTYQDVVDHIGLRTNVTRETKAAWTTRIFDAWMREQVQARQRASAQEGKSA